MLRNIFFLFIVLLITSCSENQSRKQSHNFIALNTTCFITVYGSNDIDFSEIEDIVKSLENKMSRYIPESDISKINNLSGSGYIKPDIDTMFVIDESLKYSKLSDGILDITIGPLVDIWAINEKQHVPKRVDINNSLKLVNYRDIELNNGTIKLKKEGMSLDLGAVAKGYTADLVKEYLIKSGVKSAFINLGGNLYVIGNKPDGSKWKIGLQHPRKSRGEYIGIVPLNDSSFISSGDYERYFIKDGIRYHHILDSKKGYPRSGEIISSSILSSSSLKGDALSTITFGMSVDEVQSLRKKIDFEGIFVTDKRTIYLTPKLKPIFILTDNRYRLIYD